MVVELRCTESGRTNDVWHINIERAHAILLGPRGEELTRLTSEQAAGVFQLPSFVDNVPRFGLRDGNRTVSFSVCKEGLKHLRSFVDRAIVAQGPEVIMELKSKAARSIAIGVASLIGGVGLSVAGYVLAANNPNGGRYTVFYGLAIFGIISFVRGVQNFNHYNKLARVGE
jgi:hypothetical protein